MPRSPGGSGAAIALATALLAAVALEACAAPRSRAAKGPIAEQVQAALDSGSAGFDHAAWDALLAGSVDPRGRVDYAYLQDHRAELDRYLESVAEAPLYELAPAELEALLINAYNALTVRSILEHPNVSTIRDISGVWDQARHRVGGFELTLDEVEHTLLRPYFKDPRIHFAVNCASASCAPLPRWAFDGTRLDQQLEERTRIFLSDPAHVRIDGSTVLVSRYFDWYGGDFVDPSFSPRADSVLEFVARYAAPEVALRLRSGESLELGYLDYDWSLNAAVPPRATS